MLIGMFLTGLFFGTVLGWSLTAFFYISKDK